AVHEDVRGVDSAGLARRADTAAERSARGAVAGRGACDGAMLGTIATRRAGHPFLHPEQIAGIADYFEGHPDRLSPGADARRILNMTSIKALPPASGNCLKINPVHILDFSKSTAMVEADPRGAARALLWHLRPAGVFVVAGFQPVQVHGCRPVAGPS